MKPVFALLLVILAILTSGCSSPDIPAVGSASTTPPAPAIPDLTGTWTGTMSGYDQGIGFNAHPNGTIMLIVTGQHDRIFSGRIEIIEGDAGIFTEDVAGAIGRDGRTFTLVEESGYGSGEILGKDEIELVYMNDAPPFSIAIDSLKRY